MANIFITNRCNRDCSFCFAKKRIGHTKLGSHSQNISLGNIRKVFDMLKRSDINDVRLLGGEPTLHQNFATIVTEALDRQFHVHIFSNGIISPEITEFLVQISPKDVSLLCNISPQANDSEKMRSLRNNTLERLGGRVSLGITLTSLDLEHAFLLEHIKKYNLRKRIRIGIAQPIVGGDNDYFDPKDYPGVGPFITKMANEFEREDVLLEFDCGMTMCMFTERELGILTQKTLGFTSTCRPVIDIGPNLDIWCCFPLSQILNSRFEKYKTREEMTRVYLKATQPYRSLGCKEECLSCKYLRRGQCSGGCLAHTLNAMAKLPPREVE